MGDTDTVVHVHGDQEGHTLIVVELSQVIDCD